MVLPQLATVGETLTLVDLQYILIIMLQASFPNIYFWKDKLKFMMNSIHVLVYEIVPDHYDKGLV